MHVLLYCGKYDACMSYLKHYFLFGKAFLLHVSENSAKTYVLLDFSCNLSSCIWNIYTSFILKCQRIVRITPAYAGKRQTVYRIKQFRQDHPRLRGEKRRWEPVRPPVSGSPPPTRGKEYIVFCACFHDGITPAYAGKRYFLLIAFPPFRDHPRLRGEKRAWVSQNGTAMGSPPPTRGKVKYTNIS